VNNREKENAVSTAAKNDWEKNAHCSALRAGQTECPTDQDQDAISANPHPGEHLMSCGKSGYFKL
jgi:hypothetical protein